MPACLHGKGRIKWRHFLIKCGRSFTSFFGDTETMEKCKKCDGEGYLVCKNCDGTGEDENESGVCISCGGPGRFPCRACDQTGVEKKK
jgi:hypothetical protein